MKQGFALAGTCFLVSIAAFLAYVWMSAERLPVRVATHFTMRGEADTWMSRGEHLTFMTCMGVGVPLFVVAAFLVVRKVPARFVNLPYREYWLAEERRSSTTAWLTRSALWLGCGITVGMGVLHELFLRANQQTPATLDSGPVLLVVAIMMACAVAFVIATVLHFHKPPGA
jgi:hypothetical protein